MMPSRCSFKKPKEAFSPGLRRPVITIVSLSLVALALSSPGALAARKSFFHPVVKVDIELMPDGSALVTEVREFSFRGSFSWAQLEKETQGEYGRYYIEFLGVEDAETGMALDSEISSTGSSVRIRWHYTAEDERRSFRIRYRVSGAVQRYADAAQLYWKVTGEDHERIGRLETVLEAPSPSSSVFKVFVHSDARPGVLKISEARDRATVVQSGIPVNTFVEIRAFMDPSIFPDAPVRAGETYESLMSDERAVTERWRKAEERRIAAYRERRRQLEKGLLAGPSFLLLLACVYIWFFFRYGREPDTGYEGIYEREPPLEIKPCVVPAVLSQGKARVSEMHRSFAAALIESARLGYLEISEKEEKLLVFTNRTVVYRLTGRGSALLEGGDAGEDLHWFEKDVLKTVFHEAGTGGEATSSDIQSWAKKSSGGKTRYLRFIEDRAKRLRDEFEGRLFELDDRKSARARNVFILICLVASAAFTATFFIATRHPVYLVFGAAAATIGPLLSIPLARWTPEGALNEARWIAFRRFMTDFSAMKEAGPLLIPIWEEYLVYATALGVAKKLLSNIKLLVAETGTAAPAAVWFHPLAAGGTLEGGGLAAAGSIESLSASLSNLDSLSSALSSSTGSGGGFSGGGGGGGGGGGCSAG